MGEGLELSVARRKANRLRTLSVTCRRTSPGVGRRITGSISGTATVADPVGDLREEWQAQRMRIEEWWPKLDPATQEWLIANNGDVVPTTVLGQIAKAGGDVTVDASSIGDNDPGGFLLSDAAVDWIEETANHETDSDE